MIFKLKNPNIRTKSEFMVALGRYYNNFANNVYYIYVQEQLIMSILEPTIQDLIIPWGGFPIIY